MSRRERTWDKDKLSIGSAMQAQIKVGSLVRSYDFPGSRDDCYLEGVVTEIEAGDRVKIHVTREVWEGQDEQVGARLIVWAPLGVSISYRVPCVFWLADPKVRS